MTFLDYVHADLPKLASIQSQLNGKPVTNHQALDLAGLEMELDAQSYLLDLSRDSLFRSVRDETICKAFGQTSCIKVKGRAVLDDYSRHALTVVGLITSAPTQTPNAFDPLAEFDLEEASTSQTLELAHRQALGHAAALAQHSRQCRDHRVTVQPLLVYRSFVPQVQAR